MNLDQKINIIYWSFNMSRILLTTTGAVASDIVIKELKKMNHYIVGCNMYPKEWIVDSLNVDSFYKIPPISNQIEYLEKIKEICKIEKIDFIFPMIDYEIDILIKEREWFDNNDIELCISSNKTLGIIRNKKKTADFINSNCTKIKTIPTKMFSNIDELQWDFPIVCKPYNGRSSQGLKYINSIDEWNEFIKSQNVNLEKYIVQPFIEGERVVVEVVRHPNSKHAVAMTRKELLSTPHGCSLTVLLYQEKELEFNSIELAEKLNIAGDVNFEYILDPKGQYHFIECNPRFSAGCEFACIGGYNCVKNHLSCFMDKDIEPYSFNGKKIIARKYEEYVTFEDEK